MTCVVAKPNKRGRIVVTCTVKLAKASTKAAARLTRGGAVVARRAVTGTAKLRFTLRSGRYVLSVGGTKLVVRV